MNVKLATRISAARQRLGLSLRELARRIGVSASYLMRVENGEHEPSEKHLRAICSEVELDFDETMVSAGRLPDDVVRFITRTPGALERIRRQMRRSEAAA